MEDANAMIQAETRPRRRRGVALCGRSAPLMIYATIACAAVRGYFDITRTGRARLDNIALLIVGVELGAIVTRFVAIDIRHLSVERIVAVSMGILVLTLAVLVVQIARFRYAAGTDGD